MNSTKQLLSLTDSQLRFCPPSIWPALVTTFAQRRESYVLRSDEYGMLRDGNGRIVTFPVCVLYANIEGECWSHSTVWSLS